jgi:hypothetical protein
MEKYQKLLDRLTQEEHHEFNSIVGESFIRALIRLLFEQSRDTLKVNKRQLKEITHSYATFEAAFAILWNGNAFEQKELVVPMLRSVAKIAFFAGQTSEESIDEIVSGVLKKSAQTAGKKSAAARANKAEQTWRPCALELAKESRLKDPRGSLDAVASFISDGLKKAGVIGPQHSRLKQVIAAWIKKGDLPEKS